MNGELSNPHDKFFKSFLSDKGTAKNFLENYLHTDIRRLIDFNSLSIVKESFIEKKLKEYFSDILYKVNIKGKPGFLYLLFEHKSKPEAFISLQLLRYMVEIWQLALKQKEIETSLPVIIPIVVYHGLLKWNISTDFSGLFNLKDNNLRRYIPGFKYLLNDLSHLSDKEIKGDVVLRVSLLTLKYIYSEQIREKLPELLRMLTELRDRESGLEYLETLLTYIVSATDRISVKDLKETLKIIPIGGDIMPTIAEQWIQEGKQEGIREGKQEGIRLGLLEAIEFGLKLKFGKEGLELYPRVTKIDDIDRLRSVKNLIETAADINAIKEILK